MNELNGYPDNKVLPDYRKIRGISQCLNPYHGWLPITFVTKESEEYWILWESIKMVIIATINGASEESRTLDQRFTKPLLYHLSYAGFN